MGGSATVKGGTEAVAAASNTFAAFLQWRKHKRLGRLADDAPSSVPRPGIDVGEYRIVGGHHVHAKAGFKGHGTYDLNQGFSVSQDYMRSRGWNHQAMTNKQRELFGDLARSGRTNSLAEHTRIAEEALVAGGATRGEAQALVQESLQDLARQGVIAPTRIPWQK